jgi:hypothetical protein
MRKFSVKPGRGPSAFSAIGGIFGAVFGVLWTILAINITADAPFPAVKIIFPLFGVLFVVGSIAGVIYNAYNATQPDRFSNLDVEANDADAAAAASSAKVLKDEPRGKYCTNCGAGLRDSDRFCSECGTPAR